MTFASWIVLGLVVTGVVLLIAVTVPLLPRLRRLSGAVRQLQRRAAEAQALQADLEGLQRRATVLQGRIEQLKAERAART